MLDNETDDDDNDDYYGHEKGKEVEYEQEAMENRNLAERSMSVYATVCYTFQEVDLVDRDGQKIHDILTSDRFCHLENETVIYSDGTTTTEFTDHRAVSLSVCVCVCCVCVCVYVRVYV